uniref:Retinol dehydrogenase 11 n=1 Tax=Magallana gigas TaxID=29159 RepID=K1QXE3_MAGGI|eukprot:XP_011433783.1 PREDICTED: retinol dehydrogenase 11 [Crassostrea gigas]
MELTSVALFAVFIFLLVLLALVLKRLGRNDLNITSSSLEGKTIIVTGAEQGRGIHITLELAKRKARVIMACADENKGKTARQKVVQRTGNTNVVVQHLDVSMMSSVRSFVALFKLHEKKLDILINNEEMISIKKKMTNEQFEMVFAANYFGPFLLTHLLLDLLRRSQGRVVNVGSVLPSSTVLDCGNLKAEKSFHFSRFYESKLALLIFTKELAKRTINSGVVAAYVNAGPTQTELCQDISWLFLLFQSIYSGQGLKSATKGARSVLFCALDDSVQTGGYYIDGQLMDHTPSVPASVYDEGLAKKLWEVSERLTGQSDVMGELNARLAKRGRVE